MELISPLLIILFIGAVVFSWYSRRTAKPVIDSPRFGILNLKSDTVKSLIAEDTDALLPLLGQPLQSSDVVPKCDVLFLYCDIDQDGSIRNFKDGLREVIRESGAIVVVVASENAGEAYISSGKNKCYGRVNLVMTLQRRGNVFPNFFSRLFTDMKQGVSMPVAWVKLAPQIPGHEHSDCPEAIFSCEAGQVAFK